jgi:hypothetical protein
MRLPPTTQREAEPRPDDGFQIHAQRALDAWLESLTTAERAALDDRRRRADLSYLRRLGITRDRQRA